MTMTMFDDAQDAHTNDILEEVLGPKLLSLQREATQLLDQSLWLADHIWELEGEYLSSRGTVSSPCNWGKSLTPITEYDGGDDVFERDATTAPSYDNPRERDDDIYYQLTDMRAEAAELSKRSGEAWTLFCEGILARLSPPSYYARNTQPRPQNRQQHEPQWQSEHERLYRMRQEDYQDMRLEDEEEEEEDCMSVTHSNEPAPHCYGDEDVKLAQLYGHYSTSSQGDDDADDADHDYYDYGDAEGDEEYEEPDDHEFREAIRQEYLQLAEQHLSSQAHEQQQLIGAAITPSHEFTDDGEDMARDDLEELPGVFANLTKGRRQGDHDDSGYDEEDDDNDDDNTLSYIDRLAIDGIVCADDFDSDSESFKSCFEEFDELEILD
ncbi:hypothetical protein PG987_005250 [Apiospora arundinis]